MKNLGNLMKQAQQMQAKMGEMQAKLDLMEVTGASGGGMVQVLINGKGELRKLKIDPSLVDPNDVEVLEDLIVAAFNDAKTKVDATMQDEMKKMTGGMNLPAGFKLPF
ncbi:MAG TPA: YbaB/EbfC family nucleoid-associated protein [Candidatus Sulfotelmatobacter sp.]|jgi:DNA-binding YbaB/EbfC family protein|nr:YbaB/EbfC family nucleoid-associated protein [Candidatus Sulfotelmatobacter sp.]